MEGGEAGYRFTATRTFDRLLTGFKVVHESGGGHPLPDLFCPTVRVPLRTTKLVAGARFGHDSVRDHSAPP
jgi:hypothetical protein